MKMAPPKSFLRPALPAPAALLLVLCACSTHPPGRLTTLGIITSNGEHDVVATILDRGVAGVAAYSQGRIVGPEGLPPDAEVLRVLRGSYELVPHPRLQEFRDRHSQLAALAPEPETSPEEVVAVASKLPFASLVSTHLSTYVGSDPARAASVLDLAQVLTLNGEAAHGLVRTALNDPDLADARLSRWAANEEVLESGEAVLLLARADQAGPLTLAAIIRGIDDVPFQRSGELYAVAGSRLARHPEHAAPLARFLDEVSFSDRTQALVSVLESEPAPEVVVQILGVLDELPWNDRQEVLLLAGRMVASRSEAHVALAAAAADLTGDARVAAFVEMLRWPESGPGLARELLARLDDLYGDGVLQVLETLMSSRHYEAEDIQAAAVQGAARHLYGEARSRILKELADHPGTTPANRRLARLFMSS